jgi:RNA polymerase sigma factor (sigma-70 family)
MYASGAEQQRGNEVQALADKLYRESYPHLLRIAIRNAVNQTDAEEAVNDAFAAFIRAFDAASGAPPLAWITLTLKRKCWEKRRRMYLDRQVGQEAERDSMIQSIPSRALELAERVVERDLARRRLADLKPDERDGLGLLAAGLSYREIAELRGWTYTKVNRCVSEGRAALRASVEV